MVAFSFFFAILGRFNSPSSIVSTKILSSYYRSSVPHHYLIGNLSVGGNGKTPGRNLDLIQQLRQQGIKVGVISRRLLGSQSSYYPRLVRHIDTCGLW